MSVNFPLDVVLMPAALARLEQQRASFGIAAELVVVELTESRPVEDIPALRRALEHLRGLGYGVAIDDVTPDVPRLAPLLELPFSSLKFDKSVVQAAEGSEAMRTFLAATTERAKARGLVVVAEGVESEALWEQMAAIGVDEVQGFLAARPLPVAAVPVWWDAWVGTDAPEH
jgi:EAL domain-containing protein (putative c-di-GMP-specific phosphodiesterase class I)